MVKCKDIRIPDFLVQAKVNCTVLFNHEGAHIFRSETWLGAGLQPRGIIISRCGGLCRLFPEAIEINPSVGQVDSLFLTIGSALQLLALNRV